MEILSRMLVKAVEGGFISGFKVRRVPRRISRSPAYRLLMTLSYFVLLILSSLSILDLFSCALRLSGYKVNMRKSELVSVLGC